METKRLTDKARAASKRAEELKNVPSMIRDRSSDLLQMANQLRDRPMPVVVTKPRRPLWKTAAMWFAGGMAIAAALVYFFDRRQGSLRRHMAYDKVMATGRDMQEWSGKKARHLRNKAMGTVAEMTSATESTETERTATRQY